MLLYSKRDRDKPTPVIRYNGNVCERTKRQATQMFAVGVFALAAVLLISQGVVSSTLHADLQAAHHVVQRSTPHGVATAVNDANQHVNDGAGVEEPQKPIDDDCTLDRRELVLGLGQDALPAVGSPVFPSADHTKQHLDALLSMLRNPKKVACWRQQRALIASRKSASSERFFYDLGSRAMDQSRGFLRAYPQGAQYTIVCYEANPKFNNVYTMFAKERNGHPVLEHHNEAVGIEEGTLVLTDQDVGSSIVRDAGVHKQRSRAPGDVEVKVIDFSSKLLERVATSSAETGAHVVVKMDVEKMEFSVLHRMLLSGSLLLVDELLLECHYNTNLPRDRRDATKHIGIDDCRDLVAALNFAFRQEKSSDHFEAVLWNSVKTARSSGYSERHGGFKPS
jgi:FkbM family methyltransferase